MGRSCTETRIEGFTNTNLCEGLTKRGFVCVKVICNSNFNINAAIVMLDKIL